MTILAYATSSPTPRDTETGQEELLAALCKVGAEPLRLRILRLLRRDAMHVSELCEVLDVRQPALSHHLKMMSAAGLLSSQRDGNHIFYRRQAVPARGAATGLQQALLAAADELPLHADLVERLQCLQRRREENSRNFFRENADRFRQQQDLIAAPERYASAVESLLSALPRGRNGCALEIGPGDGWLLPRLSADYQQVVAVDNAPAMLDASRETAVQAGLDNVTFVLGDTAAAPLQTLQADLVVMNMVLHHTPDPGTTLREAAGRLAPGGALLLTELCEHEQAWARDNCGDLWLGFAPEDIESWVAGAGLRETGSSYLAQRNGFRLQVRLFGAPQLPTPTAGMTTL